MDTAEGTNTDGTQAKPTPEAEAAKVAASAAAKVAADKAAADAKLLDGNGNPKSEEVLAAEKAAAEEPAKADAELAKSKEELKKTTEVKAKQVEDLVVSAGVDPSKLIANADHETGSLGVDDKVKLINKHGEAIADLIEGNIKKLLMDTKKHSTKKDKAVFDQVAKEFTGVTKQDGKETWKELASWVKENVDVSTRKEYNRMLTAGGLSAKLAVKEMVSAFKKENDMTIPAQLVAGDSDSGVSASTGFITRAEYMKQLDVFQKAGHDYDTSPEIAALNKKRMKSISSGK